MEILDLNNKQIEIGDTVKVYDLRGQENQYRAGVVGVGIVYSLSGMHGSPNRPMVWVRGITSCHTPDAVRIKFKGKKEQDCKNCMHCNEEDCDINEDMDAKVKDSCFSIDPWIAKEWYEKFYAL